MENVPTPKKDNHLGSLLASTFLATAFVGFGLVGPIVSNVLDGNRKLEETFARVVGTNDITTVNKELKEHFSTSYHPVPFHPALNFSDMTSIAKQEYLKMKDISVDYSK